mmetsp:Transcript_24458/g.77297  ORF Transcript_24458/g.77297 Transcript_24458/m.77297 type:complete len:214 (-) Transcript_24458:86-727(-)
MKRMKRSHSNELFITYLASMPAGWPFTNLAFTSTVWREPSSSTMYRPVISPISPEESNTSGSSKTKVAVPEDPSLARVSFTSGTHDSSTPRINCRAEPAMTVTMREALPVRREDMRGAALPLKAVRMPVLRNAEEPRDTAALATPWRGAATALAEKTADMMVVRRENVGGGGPHPSPLPRPLMQPRHGFVARCAAPPLSPSLLGVRCSVPVGA